MNNHFDVLIIGAGISGIGAGYHLQTKNPKTSFAILESRKDLGGTWDLFKYPGIRSDSDMYTLGFSFKPWTEAKSIADGPSILKEVSMVGNDMMLDPGIGTCGKAGQGVPVGVAQPSILINKMTVGGTKL